MVDCFITHDLGFFINSLLFQLCYALFTVVEMIDMPLSLLTLELDSSLATQSWHEYEVLTLQI